jgi:hypothetical protein
MKINFLETRSLNTVIALLPNAKLTDDEERAEDARTGRLG